MGQAILEEARQNREAVNNMVVDFAQEFDRYGRAASEFVASRARTFSLVIGIALALVINIDAARFFTVLTQDPKLRVSLIEQAEKDYAAGIEIIDATNEVLIKSPDGTYKHLEDMQKQLAEVQGQLSAAQSAGLPIGWEYFPHACLPAGVQPDGCQSEYFG